MNQGSLSLSVRLRHHSIAPNAISAAMGVQPIATHAVGDSRRSPSGRDLGGQYAETYWVYKLNDRNDADLGVAIKAANDWMSQRSQFVSNFTQGGGTVEYYVSVTAKGRLATALPANVLAECVQFGVQLSIEIFVD